MQTPLLAGRVEGTAPYKWDGKDLTLKDSLTNTVRRLGGTGLSDEQAKDLAAYVLSLPRPRTPTPHDKAAVARGKALFDSKEVGCAGCHGGPKLTNNKRQEFTSNLDKVDTPSLIGVSLSAPYFHDGSAATLRAVLLDNGMVHGMLTSAKLSDHQIDDLIAFLDTL